MTDEVHREEIVSDVSQSSRISWGAVFAGLAALISVSWLLYLLGGAIGISVADAGDYETIGQGFAIGATIWMILACVIAYFLGGMIAGRLSGKPNETVGVLHGVTVWSVGIALSVYLVYSGLASLLQTGGYLVQTTGSTVSAMASGVGAGAAEAGVQLGSAVSTAANTAAQFGGTELAENVQARLKSRAAKLVSEAEASGGPQVSQDEVRQSIEQLDSEMLQKIAQDMATGNLDEAKDTLAENVELSEKEINDLIEGVSQAMQQQLGQAEDGEGLATDLRQQMRKSVASVVVAADPSGGPQVAREDVREALKELDWQTLQAVANRIVEGKQQGAKDVLVARTNLTENQVNEIIEGVSVDVESKVAEFQQQVEEATESVSSYSQAALWSTFAASAIALVAAIFGGALGASAVERVHAKVEHVRTV